jgi:hypothetical protein
MAPRGCGSRGSVSMMARVTNFGDPSYEPTDEELAELMHEAFADVPARNSAAIAKLHEDIAKLRDEAIARRRSRLAQGDGK